MECAIAMKQVRVGMAQLVFLLRQLALVACLWILVARVLTVVLIVILVLIAQVSALHVLHLM